MHHLWKIGKTDYICCLYFNGREKMKRSFREILLRYAVATVGLVLVAVGVAFSIISDLGTAPISCPPYVVSLYGGLTVGQYTAIMHFIFILLQVVLLRKSFKAESLMQIAAAVVFGFLTDAAIWATSWIAAETYLGKAGLMLLSCVITAVGISLEVKADAWMLAGEMTTAAIAEVTGAKFRNAAVISLAISGNPTGDGEYVVIREGTLVSAFLTGWLMRFIEPLTDKIKFNK